MWQMGEYSIHKEWKMFASARKIEITHETDR